MESWEALWQHWEGNQSKIHSQKSVNDHLSGSTVVQYTCCLSAVSEIVLIEIVKKIEH